jgi:hypothetical protein
MSNQEIIEEAVNKAISNGFAFTDLLTDKVTQDVKNLTWHVTPKTIVVRFDENTFDDSLPYNLKDGKWRLVPRKRLYAYEQVIYNYHFTRALWGDEPYHNGEPVLAILLRCAQVAVEAFGELHAVDRGLRVETIHYSHNALQENKDAMVEVETESFVYELKDIAATIPIKTHQLKVIDFAGTIPAYKYHAQEMVIANSPIRYLGEHLNG